jgi:hypothetical protein
VVVSFIGDRIVDGFTTTYAISAYHHERCEFESCLWRAVLDTTLCDKVVSDMQQIDGFLRVLWFPPLRTSGPDIDALFLDSMLYEEVKFIFRTKYQFNRK